MEEALNEEEEYSEDNEEELLEMDDHSYESDIGSEDIDDDRSKDEEENEVRNKSLTKFLSLLFFYI